MDCPDDNVIAGYVEGLVGGDERRGLEEHLDDCASCLAIVASLGRLLAPEAEREEPGAEAAPGRVVGRYVLLRWLGAGGMGVVYLAYDPTLDRKIALKLIQAPEDDEADRRASERLLREARAMARLAHPNIAAVYDAGRVDEQQFIAMELLEGGTLTERLRDGPSPGEVLSFFAAAGRGLEAAHRAGLVHRDFKPDNVLFAADGRLCVSDFGLVDAGDERATLGGEEARALGGVSLRTRGGTPGYMAPEQQLGGLTDARSDQYSFCVALYRALHGEGPFDGATGEERLAAALADQVRPAPAKSRVPPRVRRAILRGLRRAPEQRWPTMDALLVALGEAPRGHRRAFAVAVVVTIAALVTVRLASPRAAVCEQPADALGGAWDGARKARVERALLATGQPFARSTWERVAPALDAYARDWTAMTTESCTATRVRGAQPDGIFSLRAVCLAQRRQELAALVDILETADRDVVESAVAATAALTPIASCGDVAALGARVHPPSDPALRRDVDAVRADVIRAKALSDAGRFRQGLELAKETVARARTTRHRPVLAEALLRQAILEWNLRRHRDAAATMLDALFNAEASGDDPVAAEGWTRSVSINLFAAEIPAAAASVPRAEAAIERAGGDPQLAEMLGRNRGIVLLAQGNVTEAESVLRATLAAQQRRLGPDAFALSDTMQDLARVEEPLGHEAEVVSLLDRADRLTEREVGPDHPDTAESAHRLAQALLQVGDLDRAEPLVRRALAVQEATYGERGIAAVLVTLGTLLDRKGQPDEGLSLIRRGIALHHASYPATHPVNALDAVALAEALLRRGQLAEARTAATEALRIWQIITPGQFKVAECGVLLGRVELALGAIDPALAALEPAVAYYEKGAGTPLAALSGRMALARALWESGKDRGRARRLAEAALAMAPGASPERAREHEAARAWLAAHASG